MKKIIKLLISITTCLFIGFGGSLVTTPAIRTWYETLNKPFFNPPNWIFAPVWTTLYILMGISLFMVWQKGLKTRRAKEAFFIFWLQLAFNFIWSFLFFGLHSPLFAFIEIIILWSAILLTIIEFKKISLPAAYLLIPYLLWVSFATLLNLSIVLLN